VVKAPIAAAIRMGTAREERAFSHPTLPQLQVDFKWPKNLIQSPL
jgi:hypothetical protein